MKKKDPNRNKFNFFKTVNLKNYKIKAIPHKFLFDGGFISISNKDSLNDFDNIKYIADFDIESTFGDNNNLFSSDINKNCIISISAFTGKYPEAKIFKVEDKKKNTKVFFINNIFPLGVIDAALKTPKKKFYKLINITNNKLLVYYIDEMTNYIKKTKNFENLYIDKYSNIPEGIDLAISVNPKFDIQKIFDLTDEKKAKTHAIKPLDASIKYQHLEWKIRNNKISSFVLKSLDNDQAKLISSFLKEDKVDFKILNHGYIAEKIKNKPSIKDISKNINKYFKVTKKARRSLEIKIPNGVYALKYIYDYKGTMGIEDPYLGCWIEKIRS